VLHKSLGSRFDHRDQWKKTRREATRIRGHIVGEKRIGSGDTRMKNMSFALTTEPFYLRRKTVTRRLGWKDLKPGQLLCGIFKGMGLKLGESPLKLAVIRVADVRRECLDEITLDDVIREGFPGMSCDQFIQMFCRFHQSCKPSTVVTRIEFQFVPGGRFNVPHLHQTSFLERRSTRVVSCKP
jgi:hypothetical protein